MLSTMVHDVNAVTRLLHSHLRNDFGAEVVL